jgi:hypothetical protein
MNAALNDPHLVPLLLFCTAVIAVGTIVTVLHRVSRVEFAQSKNEFEKLSERVRVLEAAEQRRFVMELNSRSKYTANDAVPRRGSSLGRSGDLVLQASD